MEYDLKAMLNYDGDRGTNGHYSAVCKAGDGVYYKYSDRQVNPIELQSVDKTFLYVLFYEMTPDTRLRIMGAE